MPSMKTRMLLTSSTYMINLFFSSLLTLQASKLERLSSIYAPWHTVWHRGGSGLSPSPRVRLGPKPNFFIYVVKPEPEPKLSPTYLVNFSSPKKSEPKVWSPSPTRAQKNQARSTSTKMTFQSKHLPTNALKNVNNSGTKRFTSKVLSL